MVFNYDTHTALNSIRLKYTNDLVQGQVYVPAANYLLVRTVILRVSDEDSSPQPQGIATIIVVAAFKDLAAMSNAYG